MKKSDLLWLLSLCLIPILIVLFLRMRTQNFYIHLPSNVLVTSPTELDNTIGNYITRLPHRINVSEDWEVGLTDISYTKSWYNIMRNQRIIITDKNNTDIEVDEELPAGNYENAEVICETINNIIDNFINDNRESYNISYGPRLIYHKQSNKVRMRLGYRNQISNPDPYLIPDLYLTFSRFLADFLGLTDSQGRQHPFSNSEDYIINRERIIVNTNSSNQTISENGVQEPAIVETPVNQSADQSKQLPQKPKDTPKSQVVGDNSPLKQGKPENTSNPVKSQNPSNTQRTQNPPNPQRTQDTGKAQNPANPQRTQDTGKAQNPVRTQNPTNSGRAQNQTINNKKRRLPPSNIHNPNPLNPIGIADDFNNEFLKREKRSTSVIIPRNVYIEGFREVALHGGIHSLYVYCNIIKPVLVGNFEAPLIRRVEIPNDKAFGDQCEIKYTQPQYYPLVSHEFDRIEIDIKDDSDQSIVFAFGRTAVTLHFRKKPNNVFESIYQLLH